MELTYIAKARITKRRRSQPVHIALVVRPLEIHLREELRLRREKEDNNEQGRNSRRIALSVTQRIVKALAVLPFKCGSHRTTRRIDSAALGQRGEWHGQILPDRSGRAGESQNGCEAASRQEVAAAVGQTARRIIIPCRASAYISTGLSIAVRCCVRNMGVICTWRK